MAITGRLGADCHWCRDRLALVAAALAMALLAGCATPEGGRGSVDARPRHDARADARSIVFEQPALRSGQDDTREGAAHTGLEWYDYRNDAQLTTTAGYESPIVEVEVTRSHDRHVESSGRVRRHSTHTRHRYRYRRTIR